MKFSSHHDIKLSQTEVFDRLSEFEVFERMAIKRGARVNRIDESEDISEGLKWRIGFTFRGRNRSFEVNLIEADVPNSLVFDADNPSVAGKTRIDVIPLSRTQTRLKVEAVIQQKTLGARLLVQSMKLARSKFNRRFARRVQDLAEGLEAGFE